MDNNEQVIDSTTTESQEDGTVETVVDIQDESPEELKARLAKKDEAIRQLTSRAKKAEEALKASKPKETQTQPKAPSIDLDEVTDLRLDGYSRDEVAFIIKNGGRKSLETDPFVKVAIEKIREQKKAENAIPDVDSNKSDIEKKYTQEQLMNMSVEELTKILPKSNR